MSHAIHFLERIERLNLRQADRALGLYRDPQAVAFLLRRMHLPEAVERVAVAVGPGETPGHVILTRDGDFVTCLAPGMHLVGTHLVPFATMEHELNQLGVLREALDGRVTRGAALEKLKNLFHRSEAISREEFTGLLRLRPLLGQDLLRINAQSYNDLTVFRHQWPPSSRLRGSTAEAHSLSLYWRGLWSMCHINAMLLSDVPEVERMLALLPARITMGSLFVSPLVGTCVLGLILRGWHAAGLIGEHFYPTVDEYEASDPIRTSDKVLATVGGLLSLALRHPELAPTAHARCDAIYHRVVPPHTTLDEAMDQAERETDLMGRVQRMIEVRLALYHMLLSQPARGFSGPGHNPFNALRHTHLEDLRVRTFEKHRARFAHVDDVTDEVLTALALYNRRTFDESTMNDVLALGARLVSTSRLDLPDLYLPERDLALVASPTNKVDIDAVRAHLKQTVMRPIATAPTRPGRNEPCTCGSGKKYKVCCGA